MSIHHLTEMLELPSLDPELVFNTWVSKTEEVAMGVEPMKTELHRTTHFNDLTSDGLDVIYQEYMDLEKQLKRAMSSPTLARNPSPSKRGRVG
jgi:hypothetical protein